MRIEQPKDLVAAVDAIGGTGSRKHKLEPGGCKYCDRERASGTSFHPSHDASEDCRSGKHSHCSCDTCF